VQVIAAHVTALGALLAVIFAGAIGGLLWWMLHPPRPIPVEVARARRSIDAAKRILVPTIGSSYSERGVELACRLGKEQEAEILLTYVLEVPRTLPLNAPVPEAESKAKEALERAAAIVAQHKLLSSIFIERAREAGEGIIRAARDNKVDLIVIGIRPDAGGGYDVIGRTTSSILHRAHCEVVIDRASNGGG